MSDLTRYRIGEPVGYEWLQAMIVGGALVPDDTLQQIADAWQRYAYGFKTPTDKAKAEIVLHRLLDGLEDSDD